jgi:hypothetical protein
MGRLGGLFALLAAVCLIVGFLLASDTPDGDAPAEEWVSFIDDNANMLLVRAYVFVAASLSLIAFYAFGLSPRLGGDSPQDRALRVLGAGATILAAAALASGGLVAAAVAGANSIGDVPVDASLASTLDNFAYGFILVAGGLSLAVVMLVVAIQTQRQRIFAPWVLWLSVVAIVGMLAAVVFIPFVLAPIWLAALGVTMLMRTEHAAAM